MAEVRKPVKRRYNSATRQEQAAGTSRNILAAAAEVFAERGYGRTTMESIADRKSTRLNSSHSS